MMTKKYVVTDEQNRKFQEKLRELKNHWRKKILDPERTLDGLQMLINNELVAAVRKLLL